MFAAQTKAGLAPESPFPSGDSLISWRDITAPVEPFLKAVAHRLSEQVNAFDPEICPYAQYALTNQGKQLRPALVALSAAAAGKANEDSLITVAVIIEMVHLATLVHDDVMDEAEMRRRRPTLAANWGNEISVLLGDCLFAHALKLAAGFPTPEICRAVASATNTVCSGEILQTHQRRNFTFSRAEYFKILEMKTAELFALSCDLGASQAGATGDARKALHNYGMALGTAYQVYDDCLDLFGSERTAGKSLGTDLARGKLTLPVLILLERSEILDQSEVREYIQNWDPNHLPRILELLKKYAAQTESCGIIQQYLETARQSLAPLPGSRNRSALIQLTEFLAQQTESLGVF
jgi:octaprenyl-diphosphate synthase